MKVGILFVNGMMRDEKNVSDVKKMIEQIIPGARVHVQNNDSADTSRVIEDLA